MAATALAYTYRYDAPSALETESGSSPRLRLATCTGAGEQPHFFAGAPRHAYVLGKMLLTLSDVVRTHFYEPNRLALLDPVVTASESMLRFEGFSSCCGVYARADLPGEAFDAEIAGRGTTNVDFNDPMRQALARLRDSDEVRLAVGRSEVVLERQGVATVEKKVKLPIRWLKGLGEVQAYQATLEPKIEVDGAEALRFVRTLARSLSRRGGFIVKSGRSLRLSPRLSPRQKGGGVPLYGPHRARVLEPVIAGARHVRIWTDEEGGAGGVGVSAWEIEHESARFFLVLSPEVHRGFSGEGQLLDQLASSAGRDLLRTVRAHLGWQTRIDPEQMSAVTGLESHRLHGALAALGARGLAGYDLNDGAYFHRELPFDFDLIEALQPRLENARKLLDAGDARLLGEGRDDCFEVEVRGSGVRHIVSVGKVAGAAGERCTCRWWSRYQGRRGPCKHVLVARMLVESLASGESASDQPGRP